MLIVHPHSFLSILGLATHTVSPVTETKRLGLVAVGGVIGAVLRYAIALLLGAPTDPAQVGYWPWATLIVNLVGALAIGVLAGTLTKREANVLGPLFITGVLGGFTTVSALAIEVVALIDVGSTLVAATYFAVTVAGGLIAVGIGHLLAGDRT